MNPKRPPALPTWLLKHFGCSPNNDAVLGDLVERRSLGESYLWYWKQVVIAIWSGFSSQLKNSPRPVFRGLFAGWIAYAAWLLLSSMLFRESNFPKWINSTNLVWLLGIQLLMVALSAQAAIGWVISRASSDCRKPAVICYLATNTLYGVVNFAWDRWHFWKGVTIEPGFYLGIVADMACLATLFWIAGTIATLFGSGLLTSSSRK